MARFFDIFPRLNRTQLDRDLRRLQSERHNINVNANVSGGNQVNNLNDSMNNLNHTGRNSSRIFSELRIKMGAYLAITKAVRDAVKGSIETIKSYDGYITDLANAMGSNREEAEKYLITLNKQGKELKATTSEMAESADSFVRQGKTMAETETLIKNSMILSKVAKMSSADSTDVLTTAMNSFNLTANDTISIIDKLTSVDLVSASSADGLAISLGKSAGAAKLAGVEVDKLISMLAVMKEAAPMESDEAIGNAMKSILSRMNQIKAGKFIDEETGEALNDVEKVLAKVGIAMRDTNGQFIKSELILDEVGQKWNSFDSVTQRAISTAIAGSYQYSRFINLMDGYSKVLEYTEVSQKSSGQALEKFGNYEESIQAKTKLLQNSLESLAYDTFGNSFYGSVLDATTGLVQFIEKTEALKIGLAGLGLVGGAKTFTLISTSIMNTAKSLTNFNSALNLLKSTSILATDFNKLLLYTEGLNTSQIRLILSSRLLSDQQRINILTNRGMSVEEAKATLSTYGLATAEAGATATTVTFSTAIKGLAASIKSLVLAHPILTTIVATGTVVYGTVKAYDALTTSIKEANEAMDDAVSKYESTKSELEGISSELVENERLIDELNSKGKLTYAEQGQLEELQSITKELLLQQDIQSRRANKASKEVAEKAVDAYQISYGNYDISDDEVKSKLDNEVFGVPKDEYDVTSNISGYIKSMKLLTESQEAYNQAVKDGADTEFYSDDVQYYIDMSADFRDNLDANLSDLEDKRLAMEDEYKKAILKDQEGINPLTSSEKGIIESYENIQAAMRLIYEYTDKNKWNSMQISGVLNTKEIEKTKDELISMVQSGELTPEVLESYPKLNKALSEANLFLEKGQSSAQALHNELVAMSQDYGNLDFNNEFTISSLSEYLNQDDEDIAKLKESLYELARAGEIDENTFNSTKEYRKILSDLGITSEEAAQQLLMINDLELDMSDWQTRLDNARSSVSELQGIIDEISDKGISSSSVDKIITDYPQLLRYLDDTPTLLKEINKLIDEQSESAQKAGTMLIEYNADAYNQIKSVAETTFYQIQTSHDGQITSLANMYKIDLDNYSSLAQAKKEIEFLLLGDLNQGWADHFGIVIDSFTGMAKATENLGDYYNNSENQKKVADYNRLIGELNKARERFEGNVNYGDIGTSSSSSDKDTSKEFDWIERRIENIEDRISRLRKVSDSAYSTFAEKNQALADQIHLVNEEIQLQQQAYEGYMAKANSIGLSDNYKKLVQEGAINIEKITDKELQEAISNYGEWYEKAKETQDKITDLHEQSKDLRVEAADNGANELKELLDHQAITEREYIDRMNDLWEFYYANQVELAEVAKDKKLELLEEEKSYLQSVGSAAIALLDNQIDDLEDQKEAAIKPYKDQIEILEDKKKALEDYLDDLEDERKHEELILNLQKAQYELERARSQRNKLVYKDGQMSYVTDDKAIRDAREKVDDAQFELVKFNIEQQIEAYEEQIEKLNELIDETEKYYDDQIKGLNEYKEEWQKAIDMEELAVNMQNFIDKFGEGSIGRLLSGDMSLITDWKQSYLDTLAEIDMTSTGTIGDITNKFKELSGLDFSLSVTGISEVSDKMTELADSANNAASAIGGTTGAENAQQDENTQGGSNTGGGTNLVGAIGEVKTATDTALGSSGGEGKDGESSEGSGEGAIGKFSELKTAVDAVTTAIGTGEEEEGSGEEGAISLISALQTQYEKASEILPSEIEFFNELLASITACVNGLNAMASSIESMPIGSGIPVTPHAEGTVGKAFASGTGNYKGLAHAEKNALRSEYGQPELTVYPDGTTELTTEPTMSDLPKDTVIFNEEQTKRIMNNEGTVIGNAYADGNAVLQKATTPSYLRPIQEGDKGYELIKAARVYQDMLKTNIMLPVNSIDKNVEMMARNISAVNNHTNVNSSPVVNMTVNCPGITSKEVANQVSNELEKAVFGMSNLARQKASITR